MNHGTVELPFNEVKSFVDNHPWGDCFLDNNCEDYIGCPMIILDEVLEGDELQSAIRAIYKQTYADLMSTNASDAEEAAMENWDAEQDYDDSMDYDPDDTSFLGEFAHQITNPKDTYKPSGESADFDWDAFKKELNNVINNC